MSDEPGESVWSRGLGENSSDGVHIGNIYLQGGEFKPFRGERERTHLDGTEVISGEEAVGPAALPRDVQVHIDTFVVLHGFCAKRVILRVLDREQLSRLGRGLRITRLRLPTTNTVRVESLEPDQSQLGTRYPVHAHPLGLWVVGYGVVSALSQQVLEALVLLLLLLHKLVLGKML